METINSGVKEAIVPTSDHPVASLEMSTRSEAEMPNSPLSAQMEADKPSVAVPGRVSFRRSAYMRSPRFSPSAADRKVELPSMKSDSNEIKSSKVKADQSIVKNGPKTCLQCGCSRTPLWRNGPLGPQSLCNACGLRYNKMKAGKKCRTVVREVTVTSEKTMSGSSGHHLENSTEETRVVTPRKKRSACSSAGSPKSGGRNKRRAVESPPRTTPDSNEKFLADLQLGVSLLMSFHQSRPKHFHAIESQLIV